MRLGFLSTRLAGTDGVSLETAKWAHIYQRSGHQVYFCAGELDPGLEGRLVPEMHFTHPAIQEVNSQFFRPDSSGPAALSPRLEEQIEALARQIESGLRQFVDAYAIECLVIENALAIPMNLPLALALTRFLGESGLPAIGHHHDFYWERERFQNNASPAFLEQVFAPDLPNLRHVVINSLAQASLLHQRGLNSTLIPNIHDFAVSAPGIDPFSADLRAALGLSTGHLLVLQPTRVIPRKGIELAIEWVRQLRLPEHRSALLHKEPVLVITHAAGDEGLDYLAELQEQAREKQVPLIYAAGSFAPQPKDGPGGKIYSLWSAYAHADFVTYPSLYEGFGNAFLETIYFRLPFLVNRYPVYAADLASLDFDVVEIDGSIPPEAVEKSIALIRDPVLRRQAVEKNFEIARQYFSYEAVQPEMESLLNSF